MSQKNKSEKKMFTREEERLMSDFSRNISAKSSALFYGVAFLVSIMPIWLYWRIHKIEMVPALFWFVFITLGSTYLMAFAYKNVKFILRHKIANERGVAVVIETYKKYANNKKMSRREKDEIALLQTHNVADYEATVFSIFYNNALFLAFVVLLSCYLMKSFSTQTNYICSVGIASGLSALFSTGTQ